MFVSQLAVNNTCARGLDPRSRSRRRYTTSQRFEPYTFAGCLEKRGYLTGWLMILMSFDIFQLCAEPCRCKCMRWKILQGVVRAQISSKLGTQVSPQSVGEAALASAKTACTRRGGGGQWCYGGGQGGYSGAGVKGRVGKISAPPVPQNTERSHFQLLPHSQIGIFFS